MQPILISVLTAGAVALIAWTCAAAFLARGAQPRGSGSNGARRDLGFTRLASIPTPEGWSRRWNIEALTTRLKHAGLPAETRAYVGLCWAALWMGAAAGIALAWFRHWDLLGLFLLILSLGVGALAPGLWLRWRVERRQGAIDRALADILDRLALGLEAGLGFEIALRRTAATFPGLMGEELRRAVIRLDLGTRRQDVLAGVAAVSPSQDLHAFVASVDQADQLGTSMAKALRIQTTLLRARRRRRAQEASRRLPILIVFPLVFFFLPALLIIYLAPPLLHLFLGR